MCTLPWTSCVPTDNLSYKWCLSPKELIGKQHLLPRSQHAKLIQLISETVGDSEEELREYADITNKRFSDFRMDYFTSAGSDFNTSAKERNDRIVIKMNYMYTLKGIMNV